MCLVAIDDVKSHHNPATKTISKQDGKFTVYKPCHIQRISTPGILRYTPGILAVFPFSKFLGVTTKSLDSPPPAIVKEVKPCG